MRQGRLPVVADWRTGEKAVTCPVRDVASLLQRLRLEAESLPCRPSLASVGAGAELLCVVDAARAALEAHGYYELPMPERSAWLRAIDRAIESLDAQAGQAQ